MKLPFLLQLALLASCRASQWRSWARHGAPMFADLTAQEVRAVRAYLHGLPDMNLADAHTQTMKKNTILLIELELPKKKEALKTLDRGKTRPPRQARAVVQFADQASPNLTEYSVGPLPSPTSHKPRTFKKGRLINFDSRPITLLEYHFLFQLVQRATARAHQVLLETTGGYSFLNCSDHCLTFSDVGPRGLGPGERRTWIMLQKDVEGYFLHPTGFEILINHQDLDPETWTVEKVWYNNVYFDSVDELVVKYGSGEVEKIKASEAPENNVYSTFTPRGHFSTPSNIHGPKLVEPQGPRYRTDRNFVEYAGWSFAYGVRPSSGIHVFDLRYNGERIAYEISLQEAVAIYAGDTPVAMHTKYIDSGWAMGVSTHELAPGVDCPEMATFIDLFHYYDTDTPKRYRKALCIFEMTTAIPLRRHFNSNFQGGYNFYGGLDNTVLLLRTTSTVYNYDYIWDFLFYQNGVVEVKMSATGYIHSTFFTSNGLRYGTKVYENGLGNLHTHLVHYKVDLDVAGG